MNSRERLAATLDHRQPDRVCVDFGATFVTGIHVSALTRLRRAVLGDDGFRVKVIEPYQMLGEVDDELRAALGIDVVGTLPRKSIFGTVQDDWKPFTTFDGTPCLVAGNFNTTFEPGTGDCLIYPEGDTSVPPSGRMPKGFHFFDAIIRQPPLDEDNLANLRRLAPPDATAELSLLLDHVEGREGQPVADPNFGDDDGFDLTWADVTAGARGLAQKLRRGD